MDPIWILHFHRAIHLYFALTAHRQNQLASNNMGSYFIYLLDLHYFYHLLHSICRFLRFPASAQKER